MNAKSLKRNDGERKEILIAPLKLPRVSVQRFLRFNFSNLRSNRPVGFGVPILAARMASRHFIYKHALVVSRREVARLPWARTDRLQQLHHLL
jgi:hypothetical protein